MCGEVYSFAKSMTSIIMKKICVTIRKHLKPLVIPKLTRNKIKEITIRFKCLHGIPCILGAIDGSHVPIIAPKVDPKSYYCWKGFYSTLIQGGINAKCSFWDYDYGWASNIHDWALFQKTKLGNRVMKDNFLPYKLIRDLLIQCNHGFTIHSKVRKMGCQNIKHTGILSNQIQGYQLKELLEC